MGRLPEGTKWGAKDSLTWQQSGQVDAKGIGVGGAWNKGFEVDKRRGQDKGRPRVKCKFPSLENVTAKAL